MKFVTIFFSVFLTACAGTLPSEKVDVYCDDYAVRIKEVEYFDASHAFRDGGVNAAIARAEEKLGPLLVASNVTAWTMRSEKTDVMAAARGCNVIIIVERDEEASAERRGEFFHALLAKRQANQSD